MASFRSAGMMNMGGGGMTAVSPQTWRTMGMVLGGAVVLVGVVLAVYYGVPAMSGADPAQFWANVFGIPVTQQRDDVINKDGKTTTTATVEDAMPLQQQQQVQLQQSAVVQTPVAGPETMSIAQLQAAAALVGTDADPSTNQRVILNVGKQNAQQLTNLLIQANGGQPFDQGDFSQYPSGSKDHVVHPQHVPSGSYTIGGGIASVTF